MVFDNNKLYFWKFCIIVGLVWYLVLKKILSFYFILMLKKIVYIVCIMINNVV